VWAPAVEAAGVETPATPYDMRDTFASNALAARWTVFELAKLMGTSVRMIEKHYGALIDGADQAAVRRTPTCHTAVVAPINDDHSRNTAGRWCEMQVCGSRAKQRAYRRRKATSARPGSGEDAA
jgi:predicted RNA-binding Zn ribbon-like protein